MLAEYMNDKGYVTYYLRIDLTTRQYWLRSVYEEDLSHGSGIPNWEYEGKLDLENVKSLLDSGFIKNDMGYNEGRYGLIHLAED